jgi:hypothetical protein
VRKMTAINHRHHVVAFGKTPVFATIHAYPCPNSLTLGAGGRRFKSGRPDWSFEGFRCPGAKKGLSRAVVRCFLYGLSRRAGA